jgi:transposase
MVDLETGQILHLHEGKNGNALISFLEDLKRKKAKIMAEAIDMSPAYMQAVRQLFPEVDVVHDLYRVVTIVNRAIDGTRRDMPRQLRGQAKQVIKGNRVRLVRAL